MTTPKVGRIPITDWWRLDLALLDNYAAISDAGARAVIWANPDWHQRFPDCELETLALPRIDAPDYSPDADPPSKARLDDPAAFTAFLAAL